MARVVMTDRPGVVLFEGPLAEAEEFKNRNEPRPYSVDGEPKWQLTVVPDQVQEVQE